MDTLASSTTVYSTSTGEVNPFIALPEALQGELQFIQLANGETVWAESQSDYMDEYCFVCSRATDHRGEHDDLVEQGLATYSRTTAEVYRNY